MSDIITTPRSDLVAAENIIMQIQELLAKHDYGLMMDPKDSTKDHFYLVKCERHVRQFRRVAKVYRILAEGAVWREVDHV